MIPVLLCWSCALPLAAQTPLFASFEGAAKWEAAALLEEEDARFDGGLPGWRYEVPVLRKSVAHPEEERPAILAQDSLTLGSRRLERGVEDVVDLGALREPSIFRKTRVAVQSGGVSEELVKISAVYRAVGVPEEGEGCGVVGLSLESRIKLDESLLLQRVEEEILASPGCSCEIVKAAIRAIHADAERVAAIVETAIIANPEALRMISQCAIAAAPGALAEIQAVLARLEPNRGESGAGAKSAKGAKEAAVSESAPAEPPFAGDVLDLPPVYPSMVPPVINVRRVTETD